MKYLLTIYDDESMWSDVQPGDVTAMMDGYRKFGEEVPRQRRFVAGEALESVSTATTVRVKGGERLVTDGPFAETKEQLGRLLPARLQGPRRGDRVRGQDPGSAERMHRGAAGQGLRVGAPGAAIDRLFRRESGRAVASLIRVLGDFDLAEEAVQEAWIVALERWPRDGVPRNPGAWITTTARNRAIDRLRRARVLEEKHAQLAALEALGGDAEEPDGFPDDRLRLMFTCCHPALAAEARVALTLRTLGGLSVQEVARAFLVAEPAMAKRLVRAKRKIAVAGIAYRVPEERGAAAPAAVGARRRLPDLQRGLRRDVRRGARAARAVRRGDPARPAARRADARAPGAARPARADAAPPRAPRRARRRRGAARAALRPGPLAVARGRDRGGADARRRGGAPTATGCRRRSRPSTSRTRRTGRTWRRCTRGSPRSTRAR